MEDLLLIEGYSEIAVNWNSDNYQKNAINRLAAAVNPLNLCCLEENCYSVNSEFTDSLPTTYLIQ
ncbi:MAG: hypothetical protein HOE92_00995 [Euryarchaeota archaeon]|jgi:hypothetical protein|nr:hypothetical protein [Euryarchaeota archaeon]MBT4407556.1 hypothetical protein [Euryarchaeota archaeon]